MTCHLTLGNTISGTCTECVGMYSSVIAIGSRRVDYVVCYEQCSYTKLVPQDESTHLVLCTA